MIVAYLGPAGTYSHQAALESFDGQTHDLIQFEPCDSISAVFDAVESGQSSVHRGVVPIENSFVGAINQTFDRFISSNLKIQAECELKISHCLLAQSPLDGSSISRVYSHVEALKQCQVFLDDHKLEAVAVSSTAQAADLASKDKSCAAIASLACLELYPNLSVVERDIQTDKSNATRFVQISRDLDSIPSGRDKTLIWFTLDGENEAGALCDILAVFKVHGINLTNIVSRPSHTHNWSYVFFVEFKGHRLDENVDATMKQLQNLCERVVWCGSFKSSSSN